MIVVLAPGLDLLAGILQRGDDGSFWSGQGWTPTESWLRWQPSSPKTWEYGIGPVRWADGIAYSFVVELIAPGGETTASASARALATVVPGRQAPGSMESADVSYCAVPEWFATGGRVWQ